jgi:ferredoxin
MTELDLLAFLNEEQAHLTGNIAEDRVQSLKDYMREPYGTEEDGRSSAISSDVFDMVEGMLPDLLEIFVSTDKAVVFEPVGPDDEESAKQATQACNHVFYKQNNGFLVLYEAIKDALMLKTGAIRWWWDESREVNFQSYTAEEMQLAVFLTTNPDAQVVEQDEVPTDPQEAQQYAAQGMQAPRKLRVKIKTTAKKGKVCIASIPPDELHVSARHDSLLLDKCPYVAHVSERSLSDLIDMGLDVTEDDLRGARDNETTQDREYRDAINGSDRNWRVDNSHDKSMRRGWLRDEYVLVDFDGDGIAAHRSESA